MQIRQAMRVLIHTHIACRLLVESSPQPLWTQDFLHRLRILWRTIFSRHDSCDDNFNGTIFDFNPLYALFARPSYASATCVDFEGLVERYDILWYYVRKYKILLLGFWYVCTKNRKIKSGVNSWRTRELLCLCQESVFDTHTDVDITLSVFHARQIILGRGNRLAYMGVELFFLFIGRHWWQS